MVAHLEENNLLNSKQHGFRSGKSCLTQLLHHFDDIIEALSNGDDMDAIYLDYAKAFDKVDHQLLNSYQKTAAIWFSSQNHHLDRVISYE